MSKYSGTYDAYDPEYLEVFEAVAPLTATRPTTGFTCLAEGSLDAFDAVRAEYIALGSDDRARTQRRIDFIRLAADVFGGIREGLEKINNISPEDEDILRAA
ncbi:MAG: hypothetical protein JWO35_805 [Candidatus Saccharibacteria bacterium]|nr:hypothetical protein [Candidatus Saccharibacteria bacterium]